MNKTYRILALALVVLFAVFGGGCSGNQPGAQAVKSSGAPLAVKVLDIGQGDAILIRTAERTVLVDTGDTPSREKLVSYIKKEGIATIDALIITHPHADHIGGAQAIFDNFPVKQVYDSGQVSTSNLYKQYLSIIERKKIPFALLEAGGQIELGGGAALKVLAPEKPFISGSDSDLNNNSIVLKICFGNFSMLLAADAEKEAETRMVKRYGETLKSSVLKAGHHGSSSSSTLGFLKAVAPEAVIISLGTNNDYHHPHPSVIKRYNQQKIAIYRTDTDGTLTVTSDGSTYTIKKEKQ
ncbi:MAG: MBL fold metallo-hydrolase [Negativicutes bacterium]|nr:MBL fold metallo-hydrolase [Negativicutes bacterium]